MRPRRFRIGRVLAMGVMVAVTAAAALAQRGGYRPSASYSGNVPYDGRFVFVRVSYPENYYRGGAHWAHDYPRGELHFLKILSEITNVPTHVNESSIIGLDDPELFKFPVAYMAEPGYWTLNDQQAKNLREYLLKGGFLILDDDRSGDWGYIDLAVSRVFPAGRWVELGANVGDPGYEVFHSFFEINNPHNIPQYYDVGQPSFRAIFEDNDPKKRMLILCNANTDISEYWEWSDSGIKPIDEDNEAYKIGVNEFIYAITH